MLVRIGRSVNRIASPNPHRSRETAMACKAASGLRQSAATSVTRSSIIETAPFSAQAV
jgi:hypothetical protein